MTTSNTVPDQDRKIVKATDLHRHIDEWINDAAVSSFPVKVLFATDGPDGSGQVVFMADSRGYAVYGSLPADAFVAMATPDEVDRERQRAGREAVVRGLHELADLLADGRLPIKDLLSSFTVHGRLSKDELVAVGEVLGIEPQRMFGRRFEVEWRPDGAPEFGMSVRASWQADYPACPFVFVDAGGEVEGGWVEGGEGQPCKYEDGHDVMHYSASRI